ncbi:MAG: family 78 glycoside hydrolase catalytic domain [Armatimonadetes bacterium]|nr:family 78 glycoside hydrolase catalytic domain [Armatimonadota bacterium]
MTTLLFALLLAVLAAAAQAAPKASLSPTRLKTEYAVNPIAVGESVPRFYWIVESPDRGQFQKAYQILVASSPALLANGKGDLWDSGKVASSETAHVEFGGKPLASRQRAWWKVRVWNDEGTASSWSKSASFEVALLKNSDWKAQWIGMPSAPGEANHMDDASWIWYPDQDEKGDSPSGPSIYRKEFELGSGKVTEAILLAAADNSCQVFVNGVEVGTSNSFSSIKSLDVKGKLKAGRNVLAVVANNSGGPAGLAVVLRVRQGAKETRVVTDGSWISALDSTEDWKNMAGTPTGFVPPKVVAKMGSGPWGTPRFSLPQDPSPYLRKDFATTKKVKAARLYVSALGLYEASLDGKRLGSAYFTPGWTDYAKHIQYQVFDVTAALQPGKHALGLVLGDGWYCGNVCWFGRNLYGPKPRGLAQLEIEFDDGTKQTVVSDASWRSSTGPILLNDTLMGEDHDARLEMPGWDKAGFKDSGWGTVAAEPVGSVPLVPQNDAQVRKITELKPQKVYQSPNGATVFDLGQNMVGWARLKVRGPAGTTVRLRFAEVLEPNGDIYVTNLRSAKQTDTYVLSGKGVEIWEPKFTFHGFRYVEVAGYPGLCGPDAITGVVLSSANIPTGTFECSNAMVNQLQHNIVWGMMGNYLEVPTDCPQRDERLGWMGDAQVFVRTGCFNFDIAPFMTKWIRDVRDAQSAAGAYRDVSPNALGEGNSGSPAWGDAGIIVPWTIYRCYGDKRVLERHYDSMKKWIAYLLEENPDFIWVKRSGANYGDWLSIQADTPRDVLATAYWAHSTQLLSKIAGVLGKKADETKYAKLFGQIRDAWNAKYVQPDGRIHGNTQTCYVMALRFELLPESLREKAVQYLTEDIASRNGLLSTGFVGTGILAPTLSDVQQHDAAYKLLLNEEFPSWGYTIKHGATTIWERWDGWTDTKGFQDAGMNSFNHYAFGAIGEWMYSRVAGIDLAGVEPAYGVLKINPVVGGGLTWAKGSLDTIHGKVSSSWKLEGGKFILDVTIPANTWAEVIFATPEPEKVTEGGKAIPNLDQGKGQLKKKPVLVYSKFDTATVLVGGGTYHFEAAAPKGAH